MKVQGLITFFFLSMALVGLNLGCSKKKVDAGSKYTLEEFSAILDSTLASDDKTPANVLKFSDYAPGALPANSQALIYERLSFGIIEFATEKEARDEAIRLNQYYSRNWLFDKVEGEPILEDMVILKFHAQNPNRRVQRKPVNTPHHAPGGHHVEGGGSSGGGH